MEAFFEREVKPHVPDAWIDTARRDEKDGQVGIVGYEINFNRYFYRYTPPRPLEEIEADIRAIETDIMRMLSEVTGGASAAEPGRAGEISPATGEICTAEERAGPLLYSGLKMAIGPPPC